jgi:hypothetical protein
VLDDKSEIKSWASTGFSFEAMHPSIPTHAKGVSNEHTIVNKRYQDLLTKRKESWIRGW